MLRFFLLFFSLSVVKTNAGLIQLQPTASAGITITSSASLIPTCAQLCISQAATSSTSCDAADTVCQCQPDNASKIQNAATNCVIGACGISVALQVLQDANEQCSAILAATTASNLPTASASASLPDIAPTDSVTVVIPSSAAPSVIVVPSIPGQITETPIATQIGLTGFQSVPLSTPYPPCAPVPTIASDPVDPDPTASWTDPVADPTTTWSDPIDPDPTASFSNPIANPTTIWSDPIDPDPTASFSNPIANPTTIWSDPIDPDPTASFSNPIANPTTSWSDPASPSSSDPPPPPPYYGYGFPVPSWTSSDPTDPPSSTLPFSIPALSSLIDPSSIADPTRTLPIPSSVTTTSTPLIDPLSTPVLDPSAAASSTWTGSDPTSTWPVSDPGAAASSTWPGGDPPSSSPADPSTPGPSYAPPPPPYGYGYGPRPAATISTPSSASPSFTSPSTPNNPSPSSSLTPSFHLILLPAEYSLLTYAMRIYYGATPPSPYLTSSGTSTSSSSRAGKFSITTPGGFLSSSLDPTSSKRYFGSVLEDVEANGGYTVLETSHSLADLGQRDLNGTAVLDTKSEAPYGTLFKLENGKFLGNGGQARFCTQATTAYGNEDFTFVEGSPVRVYIDGSRALPRDCKEVKLVVEWIDGGEDSTPGYA